MPQHGHASAVLVILVRLLELHPEGQDVRPLAVHHAAVGSSSRRQRGGQFPRGSGRKRANAPVHHRDEGVDDFASVARREMQDGREHRGAAQHSPLSDCRHQRQRIRTAATRARRRTRRRAQRARRRAPPVAFRRHKPHTRAPAHEWMQAHRFDAKPHAREGRLGRRGGVSGHRSVRRSATSTQRRADFLLGQEDQLRPARQRASQPSQHVLWTGRQLHAARLVLRQDKVDEEGRAASKCGPVVLQLSPRESGARSVRRVRYRVERFDRVALGLEARHRGAERPRTNGPGLRARHRHCSSQWTPRRNPGMNTQTLRHVLQSRELRPTIGVLGSSTRCANGTSMRTRYGNIVVRWQHSRCGALRCDSARHSSVRFNPNDVRWPGRGTTAHARTPSHSEWKTGSGSPKAKYESVPPTILAETLTAAPRRGGTTA
jgi:hypothetical protein